MVPLAIAPDASESSRRRTLLDVCRRKGWFDYQSENLPGFVDHPRVTHPGVTYSIVLPDKTRVTLDAAWVEGFVYCTALEYDDVAAVAWREGM